MDGHFLDLKKTAQSTFVDESFVRSHSLDSQIDVIVDSLIEFVKCKNEHSL